MTRTVAAARMTYEAQAVHHEARNLQDFFCDDVGEDGDPDGDEVADVAHVARPREGAVDHDRDDQDPDEGKDEVDLEVEGAVHDHEEGDDDEPGYERGEGIVFLRTTYHPEYPSAL